jgi:hypothetical protein
MAFEGEPRNGDYATYIDTLTNSGNRAPGQVIKELDSIGDQVRREYARAKSRWEDDEVQDANPWPTLPPANPATAPAPLQAPPQAPPQAPQYAYTLPQYVPPIATPGSQENPFSDSTRVGPAAEQTDTLASRSQAQRRALGALVGNSAIGLLGMICIGIGAEDKGNDLLEGLFLLAGAFFLLVFLRAILRLLKKDLTGTKRPLKKLPPLSTISRRDSPPR